MNSENPNQKKIAEPVTEYKSVKPQKGIEKSLDFDERFKNGLTSEAFLAEMKKRIQKYPWKK